MPHTENDNTPILIGFGQAQLDIAEDLAHAPGPIDLGVLAARAALEDAGITAETIDTIAAIRLFTDSGPSFPCPYGTSKNFPASIGTRISAGARRHLYDSIGGQSPLTLLAEFAGEIAGGSDEVVLITGAEAMGNMKAAMRAGLTPETGPDWSDAPDGPLTDRGPFSGPMLITMSAITHQIGLPIQYYGLMENARRGDIKLANYQSQMGALFAPLTEVAAQNPFAMFPRQLSATDIATPAPDNPPVGGPYLKHMVAKDGVNQAAAMILTSRGRAKALGLDLSRAVYLHRFAAASDHPLIERPNLARSIPMAWVLNEVMKDAPKLAGMDIYSCFPIVVSEAKRILGLGDDRPLTLTGGLPYFGGAGNNYTLHGICEAAQLARRSGGAKTLVYGNGGFMSKHAAALFSTEPHAWMPLTTVPDFARIPAAQATPKDAPPARAVIESQTLNYKRGVAQSVLLVLRGDDGARCYSFGDAALLDDAVNHAPLIGRDVSVGVGKSGNLATTL